MGLILTTDTRFGTQNWGQNGFIKRGSLFYWFYGDLAGKLTYRFTTSLPDGLLTASDNTLVTGIDLASLGSTGAWDIIYNPATDTIVLAYIVDNGDTTFTPTIRTGTFGVDNLITLQAAHSPLGAHTTELADMKVSFTTNNRWIFAFAEDDSTPRWVYLADDATPTGAGDWTLILTDSPLNNVTTFALQQNIAQIPGSSNSEFVLFYRGTNLLRWRRFNGTVLEAEQSMGIDSDNSSRAIVGADGDIYFVSTEFSPAEVRLIRYDVSGDSVAINVLQSGSVGDFAEGYLTQRNNGQFVIMWLNLNVFEYRALQGTLIDLTEISPQLPANLRNGTIDTNNTPRALFYDADNDQVWMSYMDFVNGTTFDLYVNNLDVPVPRLIVKFNSIR